MLYLKIIFIYTIFYLLRRST